MNIHKSQLNFDVNYRGTIGFDTLPNGFLPPGHSCFAIRMGNQLLRFLDGENGEPCRFACQ